MNRKHVLTRDDGNILIMSVVIVALLVATGMGYMRWASDEKFDSRLEEATIQAYFMAQTGLIERGLVFLRTREPADLPQGTVRLADGERVRREGSEQFDYIQHVNNIVERARGGDGNVFQRTDTYDVYSTGRVIMHGNQPGRDGNAERITVDRVATMRARLRSFANYMYLTDREVTAYNEIIWFWTQDTLYGRTHSNDYIGLKYSPVFYGPVSTSKPEFRYYNPGNIYFAYPPVFNAPPVLFPRTAATLRASGMHVPSMNGRKMTWIKMKGQEGIDIFQYPMGGVRAESLFTHIGPPNWSAIFVEGECEVEGELYGALTIGSEGDMWLIDNIYFTGANRANGQFDESTMTSILGLVSEKNIWIRNNFANGKNDGFNEEPGNINRHSITITAGMVALD